jgi:PPOX class probable F420-dependent enzyme
MGEGKLAQFANQKYLNLETYKRSGQVVQTPVWFIEDNEVLYVYTRSHSGKVKRVRRNPHVRVVPCSLRGQPKGAWIDGEAKFADAAETERVNQLIKQKYGLQKTWGDLMDKLRRTKRVAIAIHI